MPRSSSKRVDETAIEVMREEGVKLIWYGHPDTIMTISERAGCKKGHPLNRSAAVMRCIALSDLFVHAGRINHLGRYYNVYKPR